jgi:hypothetical protein
MDAFNSSATPDTARPALMREPYYTNRHNWPGRLLVHRADLIEMGSIVYGASVITDLLMADIEPQSDGKCAPLLTPNTRAGLGYALAACLSTLSAAFDRFQDQPAHGDAP